MNAGALGQTFIALCLALLLFSPENEAAAVCPAGAPATCLPGQGDWTTTLQARSFDGGATIGGYFDSSLNITWLANANAGSGSSFDNLGSTTDGRMTWGNANAWANALVVGGIGGWRLPTMTDAGLEGCNYALGTTIPPHDCGYNVDTETSDMASMFYVTLGDIAFCSPASATTVCTPQPLYGLTNTGPFSNLQSFAYWTNLAFFNPADQSAWLFNPSTGLQNFEFQSDEGYAWAVHPGDVGVAPVPLPASVWLMLSGLPGMVFLSRRRQRSGDSAT